MTASDPAAPSDELRARMQFLHPEKTLAVWQLPNAPELDRRVLASIFDVDVDAYVGVVAACRNSARNVAAELFHNAVVGAALERLPFAPGDVVVALGDSITDDYQSWVAILRELLALRGADGIRVVNHGVSGDTSTDLLRRLWHLTADRPTWAIILVGTNDARRDAVFGEMLVSHEESARNLALIRDWAVATRVRHIVWMTPPPVLEEAIAREPRAAARRLIWRNTDLAAKATIVRRQPGMTVDLQAAFAGGALDELLLPDGLHPSLAGQTLILTSLLDALARIAPPNPTGR